MILPGGSGSGSWISHMGNERACALHPQELLKGVSKEINGYC